MKTIITDTATLWINGAAMVLITAVITSIIWYFALKPVRKLEMNRKMSEHMKDEINRKDRIIENRGITINRLNIELQAERNRNRAMTEAAHVVMKIGSAPYAEYL